MHFDFEAGPGAFALATGLVVCAALMLAAGIRARRLGWLASAFCTGALGLDEVFDLHRGLRALPHQMVRTVDSPVRWALAAMVAAVVVIVFLAPLLVDLPRRVTALLLGGGAMYLMGLVAEKLQSIVTRVLEWPLPASVVDALHYGLRALGVLLLAAAPIISMRMSGDSERGRG